MISLAQPPSSSIHKTGQDALSGIGPAGCLLKFVNQGRPCQGIADIIPLEGLYSDPSIHLQH
jgi:hypothetical protein